MSSRNVSATFRQAAYAQQTERVYIILVEFDHSSWAVPVRVSNDAVNTESNGETFLACNFDVTLAEDSDERGASIEMSIGNVDRRIVDEIRTTVGPPSVRVMLVLDSDPDNIEVDQDGFELQHVSYDALVIKGRVGVESFEGEPYPGDSFTPGNFPALF